MTTSTNGALEDGPRPASRGNTQRMFDCATPTPASVGRILFVKSDTHLIGHLDRDPARPHFDRRAQSAVAADRDRKPTDPPPRERQSWHFRARQATKSAAKL